MPSLSRLESGRSCDYAQKQLSDGLQVNYRKYKEYSAQRKGTARRKIPHAWSLYLGTDCYLQAKGDEEPKTGVSTAGACLRRTVTAGDLELTESIDQHASTF